MDVILSVTHALVKSIAIPDPHGIDVAIDNSRVWVATGSQQVFEINPVTFAVTRHVLPPFSLAPGPHTWEGNQLYSPTGPCY